MRRNNFTPILWAVLLLWGAVAGAYIARTRWDDRVYDVVGHRNYTLILANRHELPKPHELWETYQPPLFYLVNTLLDSHGGHHRTLVRMASAVYGLLFLMALWRIVRRMGLSERASGLCLATILTTPAFVYLFTAYNNDSLSMALAGWFIALALEYADEPNRRKALYVLGCVALGVYTKYSFAFVVVATLATLGIWSFWRAGLFRRTVALTGLCLLGTLTLSPWLVFHNYRLTGNLTPTNFENGFEGKTLLTEGAPAFVSRLPGTDPREWSGPYAYSVDEQRWEKRSYLSDFFVTSIYGEFSHRLRMLPFAWMLVAVHFGLLLYMLATGWSHAAGRLALCAGAITVALLAAFVLHSPQTCSADFRYVAWLWIPTAALLWPRPDRRAPLFTASALLCTLATGAHLIFLSMLVFA